MQVIVISPEGADTREIAAMGGFFGLGLDRYHVRKPAWSLAELESWLCGLPRDWRPRIVLHQHHALVARLGLGGAHEKDVAGSTGGSAASRSCHEVAALRASLGTYEYVIFGPVFPSLSKIGHGPAPDFPWDELRSALSVAPRGRVLAIGGIDEGGLGRCLELGFDGVAVLGAVWNAPDPAQAFARIRDAAGKLEAARHAA
jgi:thiamine-phosphate pyrophosphorylase